MPHSTINLHQPRRILRHRHIIIMAVAQEGPLVYPLHIPTDNSEEWEAWRNLQTQSLSMPFVFALKLVDHLIWMMIWSFVLACWLTTMYGCTVLALNSRRHALLIKIIAHSSTQFTRHHPKGPCRAAHLNPLHSNNKSNQRNKLQQPSPYPQPRTTTTIPSPVSSQTIVITWRFSNLQPCALETPSR